MEFFNKVINCDDTFIDVLVVDTITGDYVKFYSLLTLATFLNITTAELNLKIKNNRFTGSGKYYLEVYDDGDGIVYEDCEVVVIEQATKTAFIFSSIKEAARFSNTSVDTIAYLVNEVDYIGCGGYVFFNFQHYINNLLPTH